MSQGLRDMLANRRFAIPLIILLAFCFIGLILVGVVLILRPGAPGEGEEVGQATLTPTLQVSERATFTPIPTGSPTTRPTPTLVPLGTSVVSVSTVTPATPTGGEATSTGAAATAEATATPTATTSSGGGATATPPTDEELADTGIGWGLILFSAVGLALLAIVARRLRLAQ